MRYLTKATPNFNALVKIAKARSPEYEKHRTVWSLFSKTEDQTRDFLYRWDQDVLWILSTTPPIESDLFASQTKAFDPKIEVGDRLEFALRVNPVVRTKVDGKRKKVDAVMHKKTSLSDEERGKWSQAELVSDASFAWLKKRRGFELDAASFRAESYRQVFVKKKGHDMRFSSVDLSGILTVTDPAHMSAHLLDGLGSARAFGCGLMLVRRV